MAKYRAVFLVPSIVEFECSGTQNEASKQAKEIADGMGKTRSLHPRQMGTPNEVYEPKILEVIVTEGVPEPEAPCMQVA